jgi:hypothetical protein
MTAAVGIAQSGTNNVSWRNRIINGAMVIDQRNAGASVNVNNFPVDRWVWYGAQTGKGTAQQNAGSVTPPAGFTNYLGFTSSSAYSVISTDYFYFQQGVEGYNVADLGWGAAGAQTITLSFWVRSSLTGTFGGALRNNVVDRSYPFTYTISAANTWEQKTLVIAGDTSGTWNKTNENGIRVMFSLGAGSAQSGTAGSWAAGNFSSATGATSVVGTNGATFYVTGVQLEAGSVASPFERRDYGRELMMCQRYYEVSESGTLSVSGSYTFIAYVAGETNGLRFTVTKRAAPTVTLYNTSGTSGQIGGNTNAATAGYIGTNGFGYIGRSGNTVGAGYYGHFAASAEL